MKLNQSERHLYTILAERAEMTLDDWIQSLPRQQLAQLEADEPDDYQSLMMDFAQLMLAGGAESPYATAQNEANWHTCPSCKQKKYASAYPGESEICRKCTRKQAEEQQEAVAEDPKSDPDPDDGRYKPCAQCGEKRYQSLFAPGRTVCKHCRKEDDVAQADPPEQEMQECKRCHVTTPVNEFSLMAGVCLVCMEVARANAQQDMARRNEGYE